MMGNPISEAREIRHRITDSMQDLHLLNKNDHTSQRDRLERLFSDLEHKHNLAAHKMTIGIVAAFVGLGSTSQTSGPFLTAKFLDTVNGFLQKLDESDIKALEGQKQLLQQDMQDSNKGDEALINRLREIDKLVDEAIGKMNRSVDRPLR